MTPGAEERAGRRPRADLVSPAPGGAGWLPRPVAEQLGRRVADLVGDLVTDLERTVPGAVVAAYVVGSAAVSDHRDRLDDVDLVLVLAGRPDALLGRLLDDVHERVERAHPDLRPDLVYTTWSDLGSPPATSGAAPGAATGAASGPPPSAPGLARRAGVTLTGADCAPTAFTRHRLLAHGVAVIGPSVSVAQVAVTRDALAAQCLREISERWTPWWERSVLLLSRAGRESLSPVVTDAVLRVARLHHTLLTGEVLSLSDVGQWALTVCEPQWSRLLRESLLVRDDPGAASLYRSPFARRRDALAFTDLLMTVDEETYGAPPVRQLPDVTRGQVEAPDRPVGRR